MPERQLAALAYLETALSANVYWKHASVALLLKKAQAVTGVKIELSGAARGRAAALDRAVRPPRCPDF